MARLTQYSIEVLRSTAGRPPILGVATTTITFSAAAAEHDPNVFVVGTTALAFNYGVVNGGDFRESASLNLLFSGNPIVRNSSLYVSAITSLGLGQAQYRNQPYPVAGGATITFTDSGSESVTAGPSLKLAQAMTTIKFAGVAGQVPALNRLVSAATTIELSPTLQVANWALLSAAAFTNVNLSGSGSEVRNAAISATTTLAMAYNGSAPRDVSASAWDAVHLAGNAGVNVFWYAGRSDSFELTTVAVASLGNPAGSSAFSMNDLADCRVVLPPGGQAPGQIGGATGISNRLNANISGSYPASYAETPSGLILIANGNDAMIRWDASSGTADTAGVQAPTTAISFGGMNAGTIIGKRTAYVRFVDAYGNYSNLSPVSNEIDCGYDRLIEGVSRGSNGQATIVSTAHGLSTGYQIVVSGVGGAGFSAMNSTTANPSWTITVVDADTFTLNGLTLPASGNQWEGAGQWSYGIQTLGYQDVPTPVETKVVRRQILRNLAGDASTYYVDIDTTDLTTTVFASTTDDETLAGNQPVNLFFDDDLPVRQPLRHAPQPQGDRLLAPGADLRRGRHHRR